jgi:AcrR family transcriptional regulator
MAFEPLTPERRRQQTRDYLLQAAAQVFSQRGFHGASLDEVAAVAGFTKGAVYSNFKSKDDLFLALMESRYEEHMKELRATLAASEGPPESHLGDLVDLVRQEVDTDGANWGALLQEFSVYALRTPTARTKLAEFQRADIESVAEIIEAERIRHGIRTDEPAQHSARIVVALMHGLFTMRLIDAEAVDQSVIESTMAFITRAMTPPPAADRRPTRRQAPTRTRPSPRSRRAGKLPT